MLTLEQIKAHRFRSAGKGLYRSEEVDMFFEDTVITLEKYKENTDELQKNNEELYQRVLALANVLNQMRAERELIQKTMIFAQRSADDLTAQTEQESERRLREADEQAERVRMGAREEVDKLLTEAQAHAENIQARAKKKAEILFGEARDTAQQELARISSETQRAQQELARISSETQQKTKEEADRKAKEDPEQKAKAARIAARKEVFISYAHADKQYRDELRAHLSMLARTTKIKWWDDTLIKTGDVWEDKISGALSRAKVTILMVSANFFASEYVWNKELPKILAAAEEEGAEVLWVPIRTCEYEGTGIAKYQAITDPASPLARRSLDERDEVYTKLVKRIKGIIT